ncbi:MAG: hypothetical protein K2W95_28520 [Candidatus Obscuribacterales bacterium]|nr:hypothetical protein [Candidatus Obscuribacterales bacterium]
MYTESHTEINNNYSACNEGDETAQNLLTAVYDRCATKTSSSEKENDEDEIFFANCFDDKDKGSDKNEVTDETVKDYTKSLENLEKNKATTKETVESFKRAIKGLKEFDEKAIEKELEKGAKDGKVHSLIVLMHLKEALEKSGFKVIAFQPEKDTGSVVMKNDKTETYIEMQFSREKGKEGALVKIRKEK